MKCRYFSTLNSTKKTAVARPKLGLAIHGALMGTLMGSITVTSHAQVVSASLEEIVVTARKREESLQDTPISITAFTSDDIASRQLDNIYQIAQSTPNLVFNNSAGLSGSSANSTIFIRGVGQLDFTLNVDAGVGLYVDGVYLSRSVGSLVDLLEVERIEVLRGPQGTLFGRNTIGGAVSITSKKPDDEFSGKAGVTLGRYDRTDAYGSINLPLTENLSNRTSLNYNKRDGYYTRLQDDEDIGDVDSLGGRSVFNWQAADNIEVFVALDGTRKREGSSPQSLVSLDLGPTSLGTLHNAVFAPMLDPSAAMGGCFAPGAVTNPVCYNEQYLTNSPYSTNSTFESVSDLDLWGVSGTVTWDLDAFTLKSITAYRDVESEFSLDLDQSPLTIFELNQTQDNTAFSQEFQALGTAFSDKLDWIVGLYYLDEDGSHHEGLFAAFADFTSGGDTTTESIAAYTQLSYRVTEKLSLTVGLRYTDDERIFTPDTMVLDRERLSLIPPGTQFLPSVPFKTSADDVTPMANVSYAWTDNFMTYFTYSEGFKGGGFTQRVAVPQLVAPSFEPEYVTMYEVGAKYTGWENRIRLNGAVFFNDYTDIQVLGTQPGVIGTSTINAGEADINGFELELTVLPVEKWLIQAGAGYLDAEYTSLSPDVLALTLDHKLANSPEWTINASTSYEFELGGGHTLTPRIDWSYRSKVYNDFDNNPNLIQDGYHLLNASLAFSSSDGLWNVVLSGRNLTDEDYLVSGDSTSDMVYGTYALPRIWAFNVERLF